MRTVTGIERTLQGLCVEFSSGAGELLVHLAAMGASGGDAETWAAGFQQDLSAATAAPASKIDQVWDTSV